MNEFDKYPEVVTQVQDIVKDGGLNVLFNSAGISPRSSFLGLKALKAKELMDVFAVNCVAPLMLTKAFVPLLKKASDANKTAAIGSQRALVVNMSKLIKDLISVWYSCHTKISIFRLNSRLDRIQQRRFSLSLSCNEIGLKRCNKIFEY